MSWYYVDNNDSIGPVELEELARLYTNKKLSDDSYVWRKGFDNWKKVKDIEERPHICGESGQEGEGESPQNDPTVVRQLNIPEPQKEKSGFNWDAIAKEHRIFKIQIGWDRNSQNKTEYGPYSLIQLVQLFKESRINAKTLIFANGMDNWMLLADVPIYESLFGDKPPVIEEDERRKHIRKPFVARMLFHDSKEVFEGLCRDVSVGGMQVLVSGFPCKVGDEISLNVHPENSDYHFVASGQVVRKLNGDIGFSFRFKELSQEAQESIHQYISKH